jgi:hypothetical protein
VGVSARICWRRVRRTSTSSSMIRNVVSRERAGFRPGVDGGIEGVATGVISSNGFGWGLGDVAALEARELEVEGRPESDFVGSVDTWERSNPHVVR